MNRHVVRFFAIAAIVGLSSLLTGCIPLPIMKGNGQLVTHTIDIADYDEINFANASMTINYAQSADAPMLTVTTDGNIYDMFEFRTKNNTLEIRAKEDFRRTRFRPTEFTVTTNSSVLKEVNVSGHSDFFLKSALTTESLNFNISGSGTINLGDTVNISGLLATGISGSAKLNTTHVRAKEYKAKISGSGTLNLNGVIERASFHISGSGDVRAFGCEIADMECRISGSGDVEATVTNSIDVGVSGSGSVKYKGNPGTINKSISGLGSVKKVD